MQEQTRPTVQPAGFITKRPPMRERFRGIVERQEWLEPVADGVQRVIGRLLAMAGRNVADLLHGTWLGHPLHPAMTDVPLGAWTAAALLDAADLGSKQPRFQPAADAFLAIGVAVAVPTAMTGMADWRHVYGYARRLGLIHAGLNSAGLLLNATSLILRVAGRRRPAAACSYVGYLSSFVAAWLGGELVYQQGIGVDRTAFQDEPKDFVTVMPEHELADGEHSGAMANGVPVLLYRRGGEVFGIAATCSHQGGPLAEGKVRDGVVTCPWHGSQFRLEDGARVHGPSTFDQPRLEVRVRNGLIEVRRAV